MNKPSVDYLITTVSLSEQEIIAKVQNMGLAGNVIVGNQKCAFDTVKTFRFQNLKLTIVFQTSIGTSANRNTILKYSNSDFLTFWDDDSIMYEGGYDLILNYVDKHKMFDAIRFNNISDNKNRPIKQIKKEGIMSFNALRSFGVCGIFFKRSILIKHNLSFNENIGPGTAINHGEDAVFLKSFTSKKLKVYQIPVAPFHIVQDRSCWYEKTDYQKYYYDQGFLYHILYGRFAYPYALIHFFKHKKIYALSFKEAKRNIKLGIKDSKSTAL